jgi:putative flippase GtrA
MTNQLARFLMVGAFAAAINIVARVLISNFVPFEVAVALAFPIALTFAFAMSRLYVFQASRDTVWKQYLRFWLVNLAALVQVWLISVGLSNWIFPAIGWTDHAELLAHMIGVASPVLTSYYVHKVFTFGTQERSSIMTNMSIETGSMQLVEGSRAASQFEYSSSSSRALIGKAAAFTLFFAIMGYLKSAGLFLDPRFWGEEATNFYVPFRTASPVQVITHVYLGNYLLLTNLAAYLATLVHPLHAPLVTTIISFGAQFVIVVQIVVLANAHRLKLYVTTLLVIAWTFLPANYEVWLTATNLQWLAGVSTLLVLAMPTDWIERHWKFLSAWLLLCGLSGVPGVLIAPVILMRAMIERSKRLAALAAILCLCAVLQLFVLLKFGTSPHRTFIVDPVVNFVPALFQTILTPLLGVDSISAISEARSTSLAGSSATALFLLGLFIAAAWQGAQSLAAYVGFSWVFVTLVQSFSGLEPDKFISPINGGRYFLFGSFALCLALAMASCARNSFARGVGIGALTLVVVTNLTSFLYSTWYLGYVSGPSWSQQIAACPNREACTITVWPGGPWNITLRPRE